MTKRSGAAGKDLVSFIASIPKVLALTPDSSHLRKGRCSVRPANLGVSPKVQNLDVLLPY